MLTINVQYADEEGMIIINETDIGEMADRPGYLYWTTNEWHVVHCYFYWIKAFRVRDTGLTIEKRFDTEHHIRHCAKEFLRRDKNLQDVATRQGASLMSGEEFVIPA